MSAGDGRVAVVLSGGGARGAYEVGVLTELLPALDARGERPVIFTGASVGAINATTAAGLRHLPDDEAARIGMERWRDVIRPHVMTPVLRKRLPVIMARYLATFVARGRGRVPSVLDHSPLDEGLRRWTDWDALHRNVASGLVQSVAVLTSEARSGRPVAFVEGPCPSPSASRSIRYVGTQLDRQHVRASASIPVLFPPVVVDTPPEASGWHFDGASRLHEPLKPAIDLGAGRLVIVSPAPPRRDLGEIDADAPPDLADAVTTVLHGLLEDALGEDLRRLTDVNRFLAEDAAGARRFRKACGKEPYAPIPYICIAPEDRGVVGKVAADVLHARYGGIKGLRDPDFPAMNWLLGGNSPLHGELLSYLLFDRDFIDELMAMGRRDARRYLDRHADDPWRLA